MIGLEHLSNSLYTLKPVARNGPFRLIHMSSTSEKRVSLSKPERARCNCSCMYLGNRLLLLMDIAGTTNRRVDGSFEMVGY